jgi:hypothetical protein
MSIASTVTATPISAEKGEYPRIAGCSVARAPTYSDYVVRLSSVDEGIELRHASVRITRRLAMVTRAINTTQRGVGPYRSAPISLLSMVMLSGIEAGNGSGFRRGRECQVSTHQWSSLL